MRRRKSGPSSGRHNTLALALLTAAVLFFLLAGVPGCMAQRIVWSARGTMIFLPSGNGF